MANVEKLVKAFEALRVFQPNPSTEDTIRKKEPAASKKEKVANCIVITDSICASSFRNFPEFPKFLGIAIETFLMLCDDPESDIRMVADECLNRTVKTLLETNLGRLQLELYKEIKKNGPQRSVRAALWRFADMAHLIRPQKCRPYLINLLPCLTKICGRPEEAVMETVTTAMVKLCPVLMPFSTDAEVKGLVNAFMLSVGSSSASARRMAASSLTLICQHSRKPVMFFGWLLSLLLDMLVPVDVGRDTYPVVGALLCLRHMVPHLTGPAENEHALSDTFGEMARGDLVEGETRKGEIRKTAAKIGTRQLQQVYEVLLHYSGHDDHNVVTATLETLQQLLKAPPPLLVHMLTTPGSIVSSSVFAKDIAARPTPCGTPDGRWAPTSDDTGLEDDLDRNSEVGTSESGSTNETSVPVFNNLEQIIDRLVVAEQPQDVVDGSGEENPKEMAGEGEGSGETETGEEVLGGMRGSYSNIEIGAVLEDTAMSQSSSVDTLSEAVPQCTAALKASGSDDRLSVTNDDAPTVDVDVTEAIQPDAPASKCIRPGDIGSIDDFDVPLVHCVRLLCSRFLLTGHKQGLLPDRLVRVSVKTLALGCVGSAVSLHPAVFLVRLHKSSPVDGELQRVCEVLLYSSHTDPQLKGNTAVLLGSLIEAGLQVSRGQFNTWLRQQLHNGDSGPTLEELASRLICILENDVSLATRLALTALQTCLPSILCSMQGDIGMQLMMSLLHLHSNPYWLVKVELLELLSEVDFKVIRFLENSGSCQTGRNNKYFLGRVQLQKYVLDNIVLHLLGDDDSRVRQVAAKALVRLTSHLFYDMDNPHGDPVTARAHHFMSSYLEPILHEWSAPPQPLIHGLVKPYHISPTARTSVITESALSRVLALIIDRLNGSTTRQLTFGCVHALALLSEEFPVTQCAASWGCNPLGAPRPPPSRSLSTGRSVRSTGSATSSLSGISWEELSSSPAGGPLPLIISLVTATPVMFHLSSHTDALHLAGNLFAGAAFKCLQNPEQVSGGDEQHWAALSDKLLVTHADLLFGHLARLLSIFAHILDETTPGPPPSKTSLPSLPNAPSLSPMKRRSKEVGSSTGTQPPGGEKVAAKPNKDPLKETERDKGRKEGLGAFYNLPQYAKLYEVLKAAYSSYKISLDLSRPDKLSLLLRATLEALSKLLEVACLPDTGKCAEELLGYLRASVCLEPIASIQCVQQLLKSLFGTNLACQCESTPSSLTGRKPGKAARLVSNVQSGLYHSCFTAPYTQFTQSLASATFRSTTQLEQDESSCLISWLRKRAERKVPAILRPDSKTDKAAVASYIRLFEPLVIKALKLYTVSSCLQLQKHVLFLLTQLIQLRVNYCLLDSDQIFIGFVIKQFEFIEEGQIRSSEVLIPHIFSFLVLLSYERYHSKCIIGIPKIIQLCDGIMASGQPPATHAIPALQPIVHEMFVVRNSGKADVGKELETQREVIISMLLRLIQYHQVLEMLLVVLHESHREGDDKWKRLSRQVTDMVLPLLAKQQINLDNQVALDVVHRLFEAVAPSVFRPVDVLLKAQFAPPHNVAGCHGIQRWMCLVLTVLRVLISQSKEEVILSRLQELGLLVSIPSRHGNTVAEQQPSPRETTTSDSDEEPPPEETFSRFLFQAIGLVVMEIEYSSRDTTTSSRHNEFLCQQLSHLLLYVTHMLQSGMYRRIAMVALKVLRMEAPSGCYSLQQISEAFRALSGSQPTLTLQWCNVLMLLNYEDQDWWGEILHTPRKYMLPSPGHGDYDASPTLATRGHSCNMEIVRQGSLILFCDYVCDNLNDAEHMTWVIINHVNDLVHLSHEPPVQDFISAIHRNSAASGLFIQAIHSRCNNLSKPSLVKKMLQCLEAIHLSQSGTLLILLIDKFLQTTHLAVARLCDTLACRRIEMLLADTPEETSNQLPLEDLEKLLQFMKSTGLTHRHTRLTSLMEKLRDMLSGDSSAPLLEHPLSQPEHPLALSVSNITAPVIDKDWFIGHVRDQCHRPSVMARECVQLLHCLDYGNILNIIMCKECNLAVLEECILLGVRHTQRALQSHQNATHGLSPPPPPSPSRGRGLDPVLQAAQLTLLRHINNVINLLPVPHRVLVYGPDLTDDTYHDRLVDEYFGETVFQLASALLAYLVTLDTFPWKPTVPDESIRDIGRFSILCVELIYSLLMRHLMPSSQQLQTMLECLSVVLQKPELVAVIGQKEQATWVCTAIRTIHQLLTSMLVFPGDNLASLPSQDSQDDLTTLGYDEYHHSTRACDQISELVHCLRTHLSPHALTPSVPPHLAGPLRNVIVQLARLPLVNSYVRTPPVIWKMGWMPSPSGDMSTSLPPLPVDFLQERDVLREFIFRVNVLGWISRQQFEETWMAMLGVLNPVSDERLVSHEEDALRCECMVLATHCVTALLVQSTLTPHSGNPTNSVCDHRPRDKPLAFLHTRVGRKLVHIRGVVECQLQSIVKPRLDHNTHHCLCQHTGGDTSSLQGALFCSNTDRLTMDNIYGLGQMSVESTWALLGLLDRDQLLDSEGSSSVATDTGASTTGLLQPLRSRSVSPPSPLTDAAKTRSSVIGGLDIHSCLQFLLDLYGQVLSPLATPRTPLMQLNATIRSVVMLSDLFTERPQFEWMLKALLELLHSHPLEDELISQYLVIGVCKAAAILGMEPAMLERVVKVIDSGLKSAHLPTKVAALYGCLYLLEANIPEVAQQVVPLVSEYLLRTLGDVTPGAFHCQQLVMVAWAVAFYITENCRSEIKDSEFDTRIFQKCIATASQPEDVTTLPVYLAILRGLERLLLANVLTSDDAETLMKLSVDRLCQPSPQRSLAALGLMLTCMYSGKHQDQWSPTQELDQPNFSSYPDNTAPDAESLIVAMERVTVLFDRIRKGFPYEARVISRVLPPFLADFFPPQNIMNKVIGEFLSSQQPHPQLMARVVFQVFDNLLNRGQRVLVRDWVMLSLSNFTQRTPVAMAIWSLTCFFISASTNPWIRSLLPYVIGRMGKTRQPTDTTLFCAVALDFCNQLTDDDDSGVTGGDLVHHFLATFQRVAQTESTYADLLTCCSSQSRRAVTTTHKTT